MIGRQKRLNSDTPPFSIQNTHHLRHKPQTRSLYAATHRIHHLSVYSLLHRTPNPSTWHLFVLLNKRFPAVGKTNADSITSPFCTTTVACQRCLPAFARAAHNYFVPLSLLLEVSLRVRRHSALRIRNRFRHGRLPPWPRVGCSKGFIAPCVQARVPRMACIFLEPCFHFPLTIFVWSYSRSNFSK